MKVAPRARASLFDRLWPVAMVALGLGLSVAWTLLLGYGFVILVGHTV